MRRSKHFVVFWQEQLRLAFAKQETIYNELQYYLRWQAKGNLSRSLGFGFGGKGGIFICMRSFRDSDKAKLINLQRKMRQLKSSKIPYFLERIASLPRVIAGG